MKKTTKEFLNSDLPKRMRCMKWSEAGKVLGDDHGQHGGPEL